jgi:hypothetical protein
MNSFDSLHWEASPDSPAGRPTLDPRLEALRTRLREARERRGGCPPWEELRSDHLPGGSRRDGRGARAAHLAECHYCSEQIHAWKQSFDHEADRLEAIELGLVRGLLAGARRIVGLGGHPAAGAAPAAVPAPAQSATARPALRLVPAPQATPTTPVAPASPAAQPIPAPTAASAAPGELRLLVVVAPEGSEPPENVALCAAVLEAETVIVPALEELDGDPDLPRVCGLVLAGDSRDPAGWKDWLKQARTRVPGKPVALLAGAAGAPRGAVPASFGDVVVGFSEPAERLLVVLEPRLR